MTSERPINEFTNAYTGKADEYHQYRWDYSPHAIHDIFNMTRITSQTVLADIGAGTGIFAKNFIERAGRIYAIEPNPEMHAITLKKFSSFDSCHVILGGSENTTLDDDSVDIITAAQAIHWFDPGPTLREFQRILRSQGWLVVIRNHLPESSYADALKNLMTPENGVSSVNSGHPKKQDAPYYYGNGNYQLHRYSFPISHDWESFLGSLLSASYTPKIEHPKYPQFRRKAEQIFTGLSSGGLVHTHGETELYVGQPEFGRKDQKHATQTYNII